MSRRAKPIRAQETTHDPDEPRPHLDETERDLAPLRRMRRVGTARAEYIALPVLPEAAPSVGRPSLTGKDHLSMLDDQEPTAADLAAIEAEWPLIEAEMTLVDAEIRVLTADPAPTALDWRRMRRAESLVMRELLKLRARRESFPIGVAA